MSTDRPPALFVCFDDRDVHLVHTLLRSLARNWPDHPRVLVNFAGPDPEALGEILEHPRVVLLEPLDEQPFQELGTTDFFPARVYTRLHLWTERFDAWGNILYLDADMVVRAPLQELMDRDEFFVVADPSETGRIFRDITDPRAQQLLSEDGLPAFDQPGDMVNSGLFLIPPRYRRREHFDALLAMGHRYADFVAYPDQALLSMWCFQQGIQPSPRLEYNFQTWMITSPHWMPVSRIKVFHGSGPDKLGSEAWWHIVRSASTILRLTSEYRELWGDTVPRGPRG